MSFEVLSTDFTDFLRADLAPKFLPAESPVPVTERKMVHFGWNFFIAISRDTMQVCTAYGRTGTKRLGPAKTYFRHNCDQLFKRKLSKMSCIVHNNSCSKSDKRK